MAKFTELTLDGFCIGTAVLFSIVFFINANLYTMPDALYTSMGAMVGYYLFGWFVWRVVKLKMGPSAPQQRYFVFLLACLSAAASILQGLSKFSKWI